MLKFSKLIESFCSNLTGYAYGDVNSAKFKLNFQDQLPITSRFRQNIQFRIVEPETGNKYI